MILHMNGLTYVFTSAAYPRSFFGPGDGPIWLDEVQCGGTENSLFDCSHQEFHDCFHFEDASVVCTCEFYLHII